MISRPLIVANWKMGLNPVDSIKLAKLIDKAAGKESHKSAVVLCPSFNVVNEIAKLAKHVGVGAQDCFWAPRGAYTGEVSPEDLASSGLTYVLVGHSERRQYLAETDEIINRKVLAALAAGLIPILCVGEKAEDRHNNCAEAVVMRQVTSALNQVKLIGSQKLYIAYEPLWAIGSSVPAEPKEAAKMHLLIRKYVLENVPADHVARRVGILYGGSVDHTNIKSFLKEKEIDGVLMGRSSWNGGEFIKCLEEIK